MRFSLVKQSGVPDELMQEFYDKGGEVDDFGTTRNRAESDKYDTLALVTNDKVIGTADLLSTGAEAVLHGCYILPDYREVLEENGKSAFEHMAAARLKNTDLPARTEATLEHGKTQHIYGKFDFLPYEYELPRSDHVASHVVMGEPHQNRRFDYESFVPETIRDFVTHVSSGFDQEPNFKQAEYQGVDVKFMEDVFAEDYDFFKIKNGDQELQQAVEAISERKDSSVNITVEVDPRNPSAYDLLAELDSEGFKAAGYKPLINGDSHEPKSPGLTMAYSNETVTAEVVPDTKEFLEAAGWNIKVIEEGELSDETEIL